MEDVNRVTYSTDVPPPTRTHTSSTFGELGFAIFCPTSLEAKYGVQKPALCALQAAHIGFCVRSHVEAGASIKNGMINRVVYPL